MAGFLPAISERLFGEKLVLPSLASWWCGETAALESGLEAFDGITMARLWSKSVALFDVFHGLVEARCPHLVCITPRAPEQRGSHISYRFPDAFALTQALIADQVIGDFRAPDVIRFGLTPLYLGFEDVWHAVEQLQQVMQSGEWQDSRFASRHAVT